MIRKLLLTINFIVLLFSFFLPCVNGADFTVAPLADTLDIAIYEVTGNYDYGLPDGSSNVFSRQAITREFYKNHADNYDFLVIFSNFDFQMPEHEAIAFYQAVKNDVHGIGKEIFDNSSFYGSDGVLQGTIDMGNISSIVSDPLDSGFSETMGTLSHELLHRWASFITFKRADNTISRDLLNTIGGHWSFLLDTAGSLEYGNRWVDNGNGTFTSLTGMRYFSPVDMYLMGLVEKSEVPPMLLIDNPEIDPDRKPESGVTINGTPQYISIDDIIAAEGERIPGVADSRKTFRVGCIYVVRPGTYSEANLLGIRKIMGSWPMWYSGLTNGRAKIAIDGNPLDELPGNPGPDEPPIDPRTTPPEITEGVTWLINNQLENGSWQDSQLTVNRDTSTVLRSLADFSTAAEAFARGVVWLENTDSANLDYLARKIELLVNSGSGGYVSADEILESQNSDGGWGSDQQYGSSPMDTAWGLHVLTALSRNSDSAVRSAIEYLLSKQNAGSAWGTEAENNLQISVEVVTALLPYLEQYQLSVPIGNALSWIYSKQNSDGSFGSGTGTVYDTAKTLILLKKIGITSQVTDQAVSFLLGTQAQNGSWFSSSYQTALAIQAILIATRDPDLSVSTEEIVPSPTVISILPTEMSLAVTARNSGMAEVTDARIVLYEGAAIDSAKIGEVSVSIPGKSSETVVFNTTVSDSRAYHYYVTVDPDNLIRESSEHNNTALRIVYPGSTYDFAIHPEDISINPAVGNVFEPLAVSAKIRNSGTIEALQVPVHLVVDSGSGPLTVATQTVSIAAGKAIEHIILWVPEISGVGISLSVIVDPYNSFAELAENNNSAAITIDINPSEKPDLTLSYSDITFNPFPALEAGSTSLKARVRNRGFSQATNVQVDFYDGVPGEDGNIYLGSVTIPSIAAGESKEASFNWEGIPVAGERVISVAVDALNMIEEVVEDNNSAFATLQVLSRPDFTIYDSAISFSPEAPHEGDRITVSAVIHNKGEQSGADIPVAFYRGTSLLGTSVIQDISAYGQGTAALSFDTEGTVGVIEVNVKVDPDGVTLDGDMSNNTAAKSIGIQNSDLWLSQNYISPNGDGVKDTVQFGCRLSVKQNVTVGIVNEMDEFVRLYNDQIYNNIDYLSFTWDGLDNKGRVVDDGQYQIQVLSATGSILANLVITVDNNRSSLVKAINSPYIFTNVFANYNTSFISNYKWLHDESGIITLINKKSYDNFSGIYKISLDGSLSRIVPEEFSEEFDAIIGYRYIKNESDCNYYTLEKKNCEQANPGFSLSKNDNILFFIIEKYNKKTNVVIGQELMSVDINNGNLELIDSFDYQNGLNYQITDIFPSPDGDHVAYKIYDNNINQHYFAVANRDGTGKVTFYPDWGTGRDSLHRLNWAPDSLKLVFADLSHAIIADLTGNMDNILPIKNPVVIFDWYGTKQILIRDFFNEPYDGVDSWSVDLSSADSPILIAENLSPLRQWDGPFGDCIKYQFLSRSPLSKNGEFIAGFNNNKSYSSNYLVCNINGFCKNTDLPTIGPYGENIVSLSPDGDKVVSNQQWASFLGIYDINNNKTDIWRVGDVNSNSYISKLAVHYNIHAVNDGESGYWGLKLNRWNWLDNKYFLAHRYPYRPQKIDVVVFNIENGKNIIFLEDRDVYRLYLSPNGRYISYIDITKSQLDGKLEITGSLLNLTAILKPTKTESLVYLKGIATDLNFSTWKIEYADQKSPGDWHIIAPLTEYSIVDDQLATWIPPYEGSFLVRLTVTDKAGNTAWDRKLVTWGKKFSVTDIYKTGELFSPNGDGIKDTVGLNYSVNEPVHLEFYVYDESGSLTKTFYQDHAQSGAYSLIWDGRDESGSIVTDGYYSIRIFDYEFFFQVDNTPPNTQLQFTPVSCGNDPIVGTALRGVAVDQNFKSWTLFYGQGDTPQEWYPLTSGVKVLANENGNQNPQVIAKYSLETSPPITFLSNKTFKVVVEDLAGNQSSAIARFNDELLLLSAWDGNKIILNKNETTGLCESSGLLSVSFLAPGIHKLTVAEMLKKNISSAVVQYRKHMQWHDTEQVLDHPADSMELLFDTSSLVPEDIAAVRVKIVTVDGLVYYTNSVLFNPPVFTAQMGCIPVGSLAPAVINMTISLPESLTSIKFQATRTVSGTASWEDLAEYGVFDGFPYQFAAPFPDSMPEGYGYPLRFVGLAEGGKVYTSNQLSVPPGQCSTGGGGGGNPPCSTNLEISYSKENASCNNINNGTATVYLSYCPGGGPEIVPDSIDYYLMDNGNWRLLKKFAPAVEGWGRISLATAGLAEGEHPLRVDLVYGDSVVQGFRENTLLVDHTLPQSRITYPSMSAPFCARKVVDEQGEIKYFTNIEGVADDTSGIHGYAIAYGQGRHPDEWFDIAEGKSCRPDSGDCRYIATKPARGELGIWDVTGLPSVEHSLQLMVTDSFGNTSCSITQANVDMNVSFLQAVVDLPIISPNGDGVKDKATISYLVGEYAKLDVKVLADATMVRTLASALEVTGGSGTIAWDGLDDQGSRVPDGDYRIEVEARDACDNIARKQISVQVDNTPPFTAIFYPGTAELLEMIAEVTGTVTDLNFESYTLEVKKSENNDLPMLLKKGDLAVENDILGIWNSFGLDGNWELILSAVDKAGNKKTTKIPVSLGTRPQLISDIKAVPSIFSPNGDGKLDITTVTFQLTDTADITIIIEDMMGNEILNESRTGVLAGSHEYQWAGLDPGGNSINEGRYKLKLHAESKAPPYVIQQEVITLTVDITQPLINVEAPQDNSYTSGILAVVGTISDLYIKDYSISISGGQNTIQLDTSSTEDGNISFSKSLDLEDGIYVLNVYAMDSAENTASQSITFTVDNTRPRIVLESPVEGDFFGGSLAEVAIRGSIEEVNLQSYSVQYASGDNPEEWIDLAAGETPPSGNIFATWTVGPDQGISDGEYAVRIIALDKAGGQSTAKAGIRIDNNPPTLAFTAPEEGAIITEAFDVIGTVNDQFLKEYTLKLANSTCADASAWSMLRSGTQPISSGKIFSFGELLSDGNYCLHLSAIDLLGNSTDKKINFSIDTKPPAPPVLSGSLEDSGVSLVWQGNTESDLAGYNLYRNSQKITSVPHGETRYLDQNLAQGEYSYTVKAVDLAGWESMDSNQVVFTVDLTPPDARIDSPKAGSQLGNYVDITGRAYSEDDFREYRISFARGENPQSWQLLRKSPVPVSYGVLMRWDVIVLEDGLYTIRLEAEDLSGNVNERFVSVTVDNTPPMPPVLLTATPSGSSVNLSWQANSEPDLAGYLAYRSGQLANGSGVVIGDLSAFLISGLGFADLDVPDGTHDYSLAAMDIAGNVSDQSNVLQVTINKRPPHLEIIYPQTGLKFEKAITVKADSEDTDIEIVQFQYQRSGESVWTDLGAPLSIRPYVVNLDAKTFGWEYGTYRLRGIATDQSGMTDPNPQVVEVLFADLTAPAAPTGIAARVNGGFISLSWSPNHEADLAGYNIYLGTQKRNSALLADTSFIDPANSTTGHYNGNYTFAVTAVDTAGNESEKISVTGTVFTPTINLPQGSVNSDFIDINGSTVPEAMVEVFRNASSGTESVGTIQADADGLFALTVSLIEGQNSIFAVATDPEGNVSRPSNLQGVGYDKPPATPTGLVAVVNNYDVTLTWNANSETDLAGYNLYRNGKKINPTEPVTASSYSASVYSSYAYRAADGNPDTYWNTYAYPDVFGPVWWDMYFSTPVNLSSIEIEWGGAEATRLMAGKDYVIQANIAGGWLDIIQVTGNSKKINSHNLENSVRATGLRIYVTDSTDSSSYKVLRIAEVRVLQKTFISQEIFEDLALADGQYDYQVSAVDTFGSESPLSQKVSAVVGDVTAPSTPLNLIASSEDSDIELVWNANTETDLAGYNIYRTSTADWRKINDVLITTPYFTDSGLKNGTYIYRVTAVDQVGNESSPSNESSAVIENPLPAPPSDLTALSSPEGKAVDLCWNVPPGAVDGYQLYRGQVSGGPYEQINSGLVRELCFHDTGLANGTEYFYVVRSVDASGNESVNSNEASAVPQDRMAPDKPLILLPTINGRPYHSPDVRVDITGFTEAGASVDMIRDQEWIDTVRALDEQVHEMFTLTGASINFYETVATPDGKNVFYSLYDNYVSGIYQHHTYYRNIEAGTSGKIDLIPEGSWGHAVSPDGTKLAYLYKEDSASARIGLYDIAAGTVEPLTTDSQVDELDFSWSRDGTKIVFDSDRGDGIYDIWMHDLPSGETSRITSNFAGIYPEISDDGQKVSFHTRDSATGQLSLYMVDTAAGTPVLLDEDIDWSGYRPSAEWSPQGSRLAFTANHDGAYDIYVYEVDTGETRRITESQATEINLQWSPDGKSIIYYIESGLETEVRKVSAEEKGHDLLLHSFTGKIGKDSTGTPTGDFNWLPGGIFYRVNTTLHRITPPGTFFFKDVVLSTGENVFTAQAEDSAGNISPPADEILILIDAADMPDLEVLDQDIFILPNGPMDGDEVTIGAAIRNRSFIPMENVNAEIYLLDAKGDIKLIHTATISQFAPNAEEWVSTKWNSTGLSGTNTVFVLLDTHAEIVESREDNNFAVKDFYVAEEAGINFDMTLNGNEFSSDELVAINMALLNSGPEKDVRLSVTVEDNTGIQIDEVAVLDKRLSSGRNEWINLTWNAGSVFAGTYQVRAVLVDSSAVVIGEKVIPFTILPDIEIVSNLKTDKSTYGPDQNVRVDLAVTNQGTNFIIPELRLTLTVADDSAVHHVEEHTLVNLSPLDSVNLSTLWNTAHNAPGGYTAAVEIFMGDTLVASNSTGFTIKPVKDISGAISVEPKVIFQGGTVRVKFSMTSSGNVAPGTVLQKIVIRDAENWTVIATQEENITLNVNDTVSGQHDFSGLDLGLGMYQVLLQADDQGIPENLASDSFAVRDGISPMVTVNSPVDGSILHDNVDLSVTAIDAGTGVATVEYQMDNGSWLPLPLVNPATAKYGTGWRPDEGDEGPHAVRFRARDLAGNQSLPVASSFVLQPKVEMNTTTDKSAYGMREEVAVRIDLTNIGWEKNVQLTARIETQGGGIVSQLTAEDLVLAADGQLSLNYSWDTGTADAGNYNVRAAVSKNGMVLAENLLGFVIEKVLVLEGTLTLTPASVPQGDLFRGDWSMANTGNFNFTGLVVDNILTDGTSAPLRSWTESIDLLKGQAVSGSFSLQTLEMPVGSYLVTLKARYESEYLDLANAHFAVTDITPPVVSIRSPAEGALVDGPIELSVVVTDDATGVESVEYSIDMGAWQSLPLADPAGNVYAALWNPVESDEGGRTISFRGRDKAGNISEPVSVGVTVELCKVYEDLTGSLQISPLPLYFSQDAVIEYILTNECNKSLDSLNIRIKIQDPVSGDIVHEAAATSFIAPKSSSSSSITHSTLNLQIQEYTVLLEIAVPDKEPRTLAESSFALQPAITMANLPLDQTNLLVWLNSQSGGNGIDPAQVTCGQDCPSYAYLKDVLDQVTDYFMIVCSRDDFEHELRNPIYTDVMIIGDRNQLTDHHKEELQEKVHSGTGLISFGWNMQGEHLSDDDEHGHHNQKESLLGITMQGTLAGNHHVISLEDSEITSSGELNIDGQLLKIVAAEDTRTTGWVTAACQNNDQIFESSRGTCLYPIIVLHEYGLARTVYAAFDFCQVFNNGYVDQLSDLIHKSMQFVHTKENALDLVPYQIRPFGLEITSPGLDFNLKVNATCADDLMIFDPSTDEWIMKYPWTAEVYVQAGETAVLPYYVFLPDQEGHFACEFDAGIYDDGKYTLLQKYLYEFVINTNRVHRLEEAIVAVENLNVTQPEHTLKRNTLKYLQMILDRQLVTDECVERNIHDISKAVNSLLGIKSVEISDIRLKLDVLLRIEQGRCYFYE